MRLMKISQSIIFKEHACGETFKKGQEVKFTGYISGYTGVFTGYMKQEPVEDGDSMLLYVKGYRDRDLEREDEEMVLVQTTRRRANSEATMCSYFPCVHKGEGQGYLDYTDGIQGQKGKYFFICGDFVAEAHIQIEEIPMELPNGEMTPEYKKAKRKRDRLLNRMYTIKKRDSLRLGFLFDYIKPNWAGAHWKLIHTYPNKAL